MPESLTISEPRRIAALPKDHAGRPVPWFVAWPDGVPDFRVADPQKLRDAVRFHQCWICGQRLGRNLAFLIGPMCVVNRTTAEPPAHRDCAEFSAQVCPFLITPNMRRRTTGLPEERTVGGVMIERNPGVIALWMTRSYQPVLVEGGVLLDIGPADEVTWWAQRRAATRAEILGSIDSGMPLLREAAEQDGPAALAQLDVKYGRALTYLPEEDKVTVTLIDGPAL